MSQDHENPILERFVRLEANGHLGHAYLFTGSQTATLLSSAMQVAAVVNCQHRTKKPCGQCDQCIKIAKGQHPDVMVLGSEADPIKIDAVRHMLGRMALRAFEAKRKVFILGAVDDMTREAANALLKTLEEPNPHTLLILWTDAPGNCLDTIISRCHRVRFFHMQEDLPQEKDRMLDAFLRRSSADVFLKNITGDREYTAQALHVLLMFTRDVLFFNRGVAINHLVFGDRQEDIQRLSSLGVDVLNRLVREIVRAKEMVNENLNAKMALSLVRQRIWGSL